MKKKITVVAASLMMGAMLLTACGGSNSSSTTTSTASKAGTASTASVASTASTVESTASTASTGDATTVTAADLANVDSTVAFGDYEAMEKLSKDIQNGIMTGKVVQVDGQVINFAKGMSYSVGQKNAETGSRIGTVFIIVGAEEDAYPSDTQHVKVTGKIVQDGLSFMIYTLPEFVEVVEE